MPQLWLELKAFLSQPLSISPEQGLAWTHVLKHRREGEDVLSSLLEKPVLYQGTEDTEREPDLGP